MSGGTSRAASTRLQTLELERAERRLRHALAEAAPPAPDRTRSAAVLAIALALFAAVFTVRQLIEDPSALLANFYAVPIALLAAEFGMRAGLAAAGFAFALVIAWGALRGVHLGWLGYLSRGAVLVTVGAVVGGYADRVQRDLALRRHGTRELELSARELQRSHEQLRQAVVRHEAFAEIARSVGGETDLRRVLDLILDRARGIVDVRALLVCLRDGDALRVAATTGPGRDRRLELASGPLAEVLAGGGVRRLAAPPGGSIALAEGLEARAVALAPLDFRGERLGVLAALDRQAGGPEFEPGDAELFSALAASAATAVATARSVAQDRLRASIAAGEQARGRWARELHDETLQGLVGLRMLLSTALRAESREEMAATIAEAGGEAKREIQNLRALIAELRPAALDELGLGPAIETLAGRSAAGAGIDVATRIALDDSAGRLDPETESTIYRVVQEALTNVAKHARASQVRVEVTRTNGSVEVQVEDDGCGFDPAASSNGLGLVGMSERVQLTGGRLEISSAPGAPTRVRAVLPAPT